MLTSPNGDEYGRIFITQKKGDIMESAIAVKKLEDISTDLGLLVMELKHTRVNFSLTSFFASGKGTTVITLVDQQDLIDHHVHFNGFTEVKV